MCQQILTIVLVAVLGAGLTVITGAPVQQAPELTIEPVAENLYNIVGSGGNVGVLVTGEGVLLVDDKFAENYDAIMENVRSVTQEPVRYVINTHYHADHSGGNSRFISVAQVISTENSRINILEGRQSNAPPDIVAAPMVFADAMSLYIGGQEVRAQHFGRGHTNGDAIVYFPAQRTVHTGDMMAGATPLIDYNGGGSIVEWTDSIDAMIDTFDFDTVIPGHGAVTDQAGLETYRDNVAALRNRVTGLIRGGASREEVGAALGMEYPAYAPGSLYLEWAVPGFMTELR